MDSNRELASQLGTRLVNEGKSLCTAESLTGGLIAATITEVAGSGKWFKGSIVTYQKEEKTRLLNVPPETLETHGAVSAHCVEAMVRHAMKLTQSDYGVAVSGEAGPDPDEKEVGLVWFGWGKEDHVWTKSHNFSGDRNAIRMQTVKEALEGLLNVSQGLMPDFN